MGKALKTELVLDWYDGIVLALVRTNWCDGTFLASLLSWSQPRRMRVLALLPIGAAEAAMIAGYHAERGWAEFIARLRELAQRIQGPVRLVVVEESSDDVLREENVGIESIREYLIADIEQALQVDIEHWMP